MKSDSLFWGCCFPQLATVQFACGTEATVCNEAEDEKALGYHTLSALYGLPGNSPGGIKTNFSTVLGAYREAPIYVLRSKADCSFNNILSAIILIIGLTKKKKKSSRPGDRDEDGGCRSFQGVTQYQPSNWKAVIYSRSFKSSTHVDKYTGLQKCLLQTHSPRSMKAQCSERRLGWCASWS